MWSVLPKQSLFCIDLAQTCNKVAIFDKNIYRVNLVITNKLIIFGT